jgi:hypothetical protein
MRVESRCDLYSSSKLIPIYHGFVISHGHVKLFEERMGRRLTDLTSRTYSENQYRGLLVEFFEQDGWRVTHEASSADQGAVLAIARGSLSYTVMLKVSSEGRRDRLVALLSQAILEARAAASISPEKHDPLAVIAAPSILRSTADELIEFRSKFAPEAAVGIFDREGLRQFRGPGLEKLIAAPPRSARKQKLRVPDSANLFGGLNLWLLKVLLAPLVPEDLLEAPREHYRNASELAKAAGVSVMSAFRFVRQLERDDFLDMESDFLRLVRREELMRRWQAAYLRPMPEMPLRWSDPTNNEHQVVAALRALNDTSSFGSARFACLGHSAAAEFLGFGPALRVPPRLYLESLDRAVLTRVRLSPEGAEFRPDLFVRQPVFRKSVFEAAVTRDGALVSDIIQIWLDITSPPAHDNALADQIRQRALAKIFMEQI